MLNDKSSMTKPIYRAFKIEVLCKLSDLLIFNKNVINIISGQQGAATLKGNSSRKIAYLQVFSFRKRETAT